jgi:Flp pilus assembly pilin Flp
MQLIRAKKASEPGRGASERGATAVEYALMVGLVAIGIITAVSFLRTKVSSTLELAAPQIAKYRVYDNGVAFGYAQITMAGKVFDGNLYHDSVMTIKWDPLKGSRTMNSVNFVRDCSLHFAGCSGTWVGTIDAGGTITGTYSGTEGNGSFSMVPL